MAPESFNVKSSEFSRLTIQTTLSAVNHPLKVDTIVFKIKITDVSEMICRSNSYCDMIGLSRGVGEWEERLKFGIGVCERTTGL